MKYKELFDHKRVVTKQGNAGTVISFDAAVPELRAAFSFLCPPTPKSKLRATVKLDNGNTVSPYISTLRKEEDA